ncbi:GTPase-activating protein SAC7 [Candida viswanathii]|uniref:GTPase-activating protein SAC7 n=1 Tax=Candida viswanathii TaxID=5486 RepID=A0A367YIG4_9ASCO|nr:GTPase-activating protein SAC7 [Candida viswanathii]
MWGLPKKNGLTVEGIFRVGGSSKRIKELQVIFNTPPNYGKKLNWDGFTVHDAASVLRRYLNALPEPLIPLDMYELFREPLRSRNRIISYMKYKAENPAKALPKDALVGTSNSSVSRPSLPPNSNSNTNNNNSTSDLLDSSQLLTEANVGRLNSDNIPRKNSEGSSNVFSQTPQVQLSEEEINIRNKKKSKNYKKLTNEIHSAIDEYKLLVNALPVASKQLLFYILDLLAMVQNHSKENLMSSRNLAAIFQPSILSHPSHDLDPIEYALSQSVVEFLIQYAYKLLPNHEATVLSPEATSPTTKSAMPTHISTNTADFAPAESDVTSTSTSPLGEEAHLTKEAYPHRHPSISSGGAAVANHDDLVSGYQHNVTGSLPFDSDMESDIGSDLDELHFQQLKLNEGSPVKMHPHEKSASPHPVPSAIVVSTPSSLSVTHIKNEV